MLQAWISSPRGSLYFAAEATPYNLEHLRAHVLALHGSGGAGACLALNLGGEKNGEALAEVADMPNELTGEGGPGPLLAARRGTASVRERRRGRPPAGAATDRRARAATAAGERARLTEVGRRRDTRAWARVPPPAARFRTPALPITG